MATGRLRSQDKSRVRPRDPAPRGNADSNEATQGTAQVPQIRRDWHAPVKSHIG
jgi:hypothetical protein